MNITAQLAAQRQRATQILCKKPSNLLASRGIVRLVKDDKKLSSFDVKDAPLEKVNPFGLPAPLNNAAGEISLLVLTQKKTLL